MTDLPPDPAAALIADYYDAVRTRRNPVQRRTAAQFYTALAPSAFVAHATLGGGNGNDDDDDDAAGPITDLACGAGMLVLAAVRAAHERHGLPIADAVRRTIIADLDLGAVATARRVLSSLSPPAAPAAYWADMILGIAWRLGRVDLNPLDDLETIDKANAEFSRRCAEWAPRAPVRPPPFGTAHVRADGTIEFHWEPAAALAIYGSASASAPKS